MLFCRAAAGLCAAALLAAGPAARGAVVAEVEPNNTRSGATAIALSAFTAPGANVFGSLPTATLTGAIGAASDVDFFSFAGLAGELVYFDVDDSPRTIDTILSLFSGNGTLLAFDDDFDFADPGSASVSDSFLGTITLPATGTYFLAVSAFANFPAQRFAPGLITLTAPNGLNGGSLTPNALAGVDTFAGGSSETGAYRVEFSRSGASPGVIPEPSTGLLAAIGLLPLAAAVLRARRRRNAA